MGSEFEVLGNNGDFNDGVGGGTVNAWIDDDPYMQWGHNRGARGRQKGYFSTTGSREPSPQWTQEDLLKYLQKIQFKVLLLTIFLLIWILTICLLP